MTNAAATHDNVPAPAKRQTVKDLFLSDSVQQSLRDVLPRHMTPDRLAKVALVEISKNPTLGRCHPQSLLKCLMQSAELGLDFGGVLGQAYMVPYRTEATFIVGYRGLITLARRSGEIASIAAYCVYEGEPFTVTAGLEGTIKHEINYTVARTADKVIAAYAVAKLKDEGSEPVFEVMSRGEIDAIRRRSKAGSNGPWVTDYAEMAKKTVVRRLAKYLPLSPEDPVAKAMALDGDRLAEEQASTATADLNAMLTEEASEIDTSPDAGEDAEAEHQAASNSHQDDSPEASGNDAPANGDAADDANGQDAGAGSDRAFDELVALLAKKCGCTEKAAFDKLQSVFSKFGIDPNNPPADRVKDFRSRIEQGDLKV